MPVEANDGVASALVLGMNADGVVIGASGGQFLMGDDELVSPSPTAPATSAVEVPAESSDGNPPPDSPLAAAMRVEGRVLS